MSPSPPSPLSPTQRELGEIEIALYVRDAFGPDAEVVAMVPLSGGGFASVTRIDLADGRSVVLKVGPSSGTGILAYEDGVVGAEARYLELVERHLPGAPFPRLLHHGVDGSSSGSEWLVTEFVPGVALTALEQEPDKATVRADLGAAVARLHTITGDHFGYDGGRACGRSWREAYSAIVESLLEDVARWNVHLVVEVEGLMRRCYVPGPRRLRVARSGSAFLRGRNPWTSAQPRLVDVVAHRAGRVVRVAVHQRLQDLVVAGVGLLPVG